jgi:hypothetical protein
MNVALHSSALAIGLATFAMIGCNRNTDDRSMGTRPAAPSTTEQRRAEERREEQRAEDRRAEERRAEERRAETRRTEEQREAKRAEDRRAEERRAEDRPRTTHDPRSVGGGPTEPARTTTPESAVGRIAQARCDREVRCHNVGRKEKYETRSECAEKMQNDRRGDINVNECRAGVSEKELDNCLEAIRTEDCGNPIDAISRLNACRSGNLCLK